MLSATSHVAWRIGRLGRGHIGFLLPESQKHNFISNIILHSTSGEMVREGHEIKDQKSGFNIIINVVMDLQLGVSIDMTF